MNPDTLARTSRSNSGSSLFWKCVVVAGGGLTAYFLFGRKALASEDETGEDVPPSEAKPPLTVPFVPQVLTPFVPPAAPSPQTPFTPSPPPSTPLPQFVFPALGLKAIEVLSRDIGAKEVPPGSNRGPVVDRINRGVYNDGEKYVGLPWCGMACRYAYEKAAQELGLPKPFALINSLSLAAVSSWGKHFKAFRLVEPKPGSVGLLGDDHIVLVSRVDGDNVYSVEGNHGSALATVKRKKAAFTGGFYDVEAYVKQNAVRGVA